VDLNADVDNCGVCFKQCDAGWVCVGGDCVLNCPPGLDKCVDICTNLAFDPNNCGICGKACEGGDNTVSVCIGGECSTVCQTGFADCNFNLDDGCEINLAESLDNCGGCGQPCQGGQHTDSVCDVGICKTTCSDNWGDCNENMGDGCEVNLTATLAHCGECGNSCGAGPHMVAACVAGECEASCENNWEDCDNNPDNGCEADLQSDKKNCGQCGKDCGSKSCVSGECYSCDPASEVLYQGKCYYLDGSKGQCDPGYVLAPQSVLYVIASQFGGKNYKHQVSGNCCIYNAEPDEDFGMKHHCNTNGPFTNDDVSPGAAGCTNQYNFSTKQLTLCMSQ